MTTGFGRFAAVIVNLLAAVGTAAAEPTVLHAVASENDGARITVPDSGCVLANNVWDRKVTPAGFSQGIFVEKLGDEMLPGWHWNAPGKRSIVLGMPEIICGDKPWDEPVKLQPEFPFRAGEKRLQANFDVDVKATGRYNMAFSLWAVSKLPAIKQNISLEIMIWNVNAGVTYAATKTGTLDAGGRTFDVYVKTDQGVITGPDPFTWRLVMFIAHKPLLKGSIDFTPFIDYLLERRMLTRDHYLTSLELGNEVSHGAGTVEIRKLELSVR